MKLSQESVQEFIELYKKDFDQELTFLQAEEMASELLSFYLLVIPH